MSLKFRERLMLLQSVLGISKQEMRRTVGGKYENLSNRHFVLIMDLLEKRLDRIITSDDFPRYGLIKKLIGEELSDLIKDYDQASDFLIRHLKGAGWLPVNDVVQMGEEAGIFRDELMAAAKRQEVLRATIDKKRCWKLP